MTYTDHSKVLKQIEKKPGKYARYKKYSIPKDRVGGILKKKCTRCGRTGGHISKYGLHLCRQCFRDIATKIGFKKYK